MTPLDAALAPARDSGDLFVAWAIALKTFFATLCLAALISLDTAADRWRAGDMAAVTVYLPSGAAPETAEAAAETMRLTPGVESAELMTPEAVAALLAPVLGRDLPADLPLPVPIDVRVAPGRIVDWTEAEARLNLAAPGAALDAGADRVRRLVAFARVAQAIAAAALAFAAAVAVIAAAFATRAGLAARRDAVELVHWLGAEDRDIVRSFQRRALSLGLRGGAIGTGAAAAALLALGHVARRLDARLLLDLDLPTLAWGAFALVPLAGALAAVLAARVTARRAVARML